MKTKLTLPFSGLKSDNWRNLLIFFIICFYSLFFSAVIAGNAKGSDFELYWSTGKIAVEKGYGQIYSLSELKIVQQEIISHSGGTRSVNDGLFSPFPIMYFSIFIIPFQILSNFSIKDGCLIWTILNLAALIGYLFFFLKKVDPENKSNGNSLKLLIPFLVSYAVFFNITCGQVEVFVLICAGEFVRHASNKKFFLSGFWLGGLLIKPPLLILVIPLFLVLRYWRMILGFFVSSVIILGTSFLLSGKDGMQQLINLWTNVTGSTAPTAPEIMINWRMVGINLNSFLYTTLGSVISILGILLTLVAVFHLVRHMPQIGSLTWMLAMLGIFSATLSITWHSHYHMAMVLIPFLLYSLIHKLLPGKIILSWCIITPLVFIGTYLLMTLFFVISGTTPTNIHMKVIAFAGLILDMIILFSVLKAVKVQNSAK